MSHDIKNATLGNVTLLAVTAADFDELAELRIVAMRKSLERLGRFDPERARERLRNSFYPSEIRFIALAGQHLGFYTYRRADDGFHFESFVR